MDWRGFVSKTKDDNAVSTSKERQGCRSRRAQHQKNWARSGPSPQCKIHRLRAFYARPREAPGLSAGGLQVARRQVTLKPPLPGSHQNANGPRLLTGASIIAAVRAVTRGPSDPPARCAP